MTLRESLLKAIAARLQHKERWAAFVAEHPVAPSVEEEALLRTLYEAVDIPVAEWGPLCVSAERLRKQAVSQQLDDEADTQIREAEAFLDLTADRFLHWPWAALDEVVGGMAPGTLHYIVCPSKGGKTTLCRSAVTQWCKQGKKVLYGGFEMKAETLRTMAAAEEVGLDPGDILTGAWLHHEHYGSMRAEMVRAYQMQRHPDHWYQNLRFTGFESVGPKEVEQMMETAHTWGADVVVIDHVDHLDGDGKATEFEVSIRANKLLLRLAKKYNLTVIITSQTNQTGRQHDRWRDHKPLRDEVVRFGDIKKQVATTMIGFFRPLKPGVTKEERDQVEYGERDATDLLLSGANRFNVIASRTYGSRIGRTGLVGWERGRIVDAPHALLAEYEARRHAIKTNKDV